MGRQRSAHAHPHACPSLCLCVCVSVSMCIRTGKRGILTVSGASAQLGLFWYTLPKLPTAHLSIDLSGSPINISTSLKPLPARVLHLASVIELNIEAPLKPVTQQQQKKTFHCLCANWKHTRRFPLRSAWPELHLLLLNYLHLSATLPLRLLLCSICY